MKFAAMVQRAQSKRKRYKTPPWCFQHITLNLARMGHEGANGYIQWSLSTRE